ncbi:FAD-dependent oxidoreductase [Thermus scotoductus]|uniref:FAD-dependent oxidoreductase n=1 Tax=Thermus scotoductus TaxID=37636 RepID=UPI000F80FD41|nr:FAD-dependent oxidoreductase [Thermus scotoductus]
MQDYQVLIVGAGFAGSEAAYRLAQRGVRVGLLTQSLDSVMMPFLPPMPPFPEGSLLAQVYHPADPRLWAFHARAKYLLENQPNLHLFQATASTTSQALGFRFLKREREVPQTPGTPGYTVSYHAFHPEEWEEATFRLTRLEGLYAVGLCVREGEYALMSQEGLRLAEHLLHKLG